MVIVDSRLISSRCTFPRGGLFILAYKSDWLILFLTTKKVENFQFSSATQKAKQSLPDRKSEPNGNQP